MLAHDLAMGVALMRLLRLLFWAEISLKTKKIYLSYPKSTVWWGALAHSVVQ